MSFIGDAFVAGVGRPDPAAPSGLRFSSETMQFSWGRLHAEVGAGWYMNRFFYLFGEGLDRLAPCLDAWSFLVPPGHPDRMIIGRNAHGAILVLENANRPDAGLGEVYLLDPTTVSYWTDPNVHFRSLLGSWLPEKLVPHFLENEVYEAWLKRSGEYLGEDEILAMRAPRGLGGKMDLDNFQVENIVAYYQTTGPIYAKSLGKTP